MVTHRVIIEVIIIIIIIIIIITRVYSPLRALAYQPTSGLTSTCPQIEVKYNPTSLEMTCGQHVESSAVVLEDQDYRYKSVYQ